MLFLCLDLCHIRSLHGSLSDQITKTLSLPPTCHIKSKEQNHVLVYLQCHPYDKDRFDLGRI